MDKFINDYLKYIPEDLQIQFKKDIFTHIDFVTDMNFDIGYDQGYDQGYSDGYNEGCSDGYNEGYGDCEYLNGFNPRYIKI